MIVTLTTDFGLRDAYVASMKGVILGINPRATLVDICHHIEPQGITQAAFVLETTHRYFPPGTIHVVVVDPGVGTQRRALLLKTSSALFVAPDNGVLSYIVEEAGSEMEAFHLTNPNYWHHPVSTTFHGRDIFAPVAAHLSLGTPPHEFGEPFSSPLTFPIPRPTWTADGSLHGHILHIDAFGNLITDIKAQDLTPGQVVIEVGGERIEGLTHTYTGGEKFLALIGSSGYLEVAAPKKNAASLLAAKIGDPVKIGKEP
jgi:hypothetical protein